MSKFLIGGASASHQIEGNNFRNNWWEWEIKRNIERSGVACNSWNEYKRDIDCIKNLGCNAYRFSIEWSRICLTEFKVDKKALARYKDMVMYCKEKGIEPIVTLHHFTRPMWYDRKYGGLHSKHMLRCFQSYVSLVIKEMGKHVKYWTTFNEPMMECVNGYLRGERPPGFKGDFGSMFLALENILDCHCLAYDMIKMENPEAQVGIAKNLADFEKQYSYDLLKSKLEDEIAKNYNFGLLDALTRGVFKFGLSLMDFGKLGSIGSKQKVKNPLWKGKIDFIGINHYNVAYVDITYRVYDQVDVKLGLPESGRMQNCMGWDIKPESMGNIIDMLRKRYGNIPLMVTESGNCEENEVDWDRMNLVMNSHMKDVLERAKTDKNIWGYLWWTCPFSNWEWEDGYKPKFGLYYMDNGVPVLKSAGKKYREIAKKYLA